MFGISNAAFAIIVLGIAIIFAFRNKIYSFASDKYAQYKADQKRRELYDRLDRNADGKYIHKDYLKRVDAQKKAQIKKNREKQEDLK